MSQSSRRLRNLIEPIAGAVYFAPEVQWHFRDLGLPTSPAADGATAWEVHEAGAVAYGPQYFCSRSACMGRLNGAAVAAIFGLFEPSVVEDSVRRGWAITSPDDVLHARLQGTIDALERLLGGVPSHVEVATRILGNGARGVVIGGHPVAAGLLDQPVPDHPLGALWHAANILREHRGDSHNNAWASFGLDAIEIGLLTELERGLSLKSHVTTRGWSDGEIDAAVERLQTRGWMDGAALTPEGTLARAEIELATDRQETRIVDAIGNDMDELLMLLEAWCTEILRGGGYHIAPDKLLGGAASAEQVPQKR